MPYMAQRTAPDGTIIEEEIPTPEEEAMLASAGGYGPAPIPPPAQTAAPLVEPGTPPPPTQQIAYPTAGPAEYNPMGNAGTEQGYGQETAATYGAYQEPVPAPTQAYNHGSAEPDYAATNPFAIRAGGDPNTLRSQAAYSPPPLATVPEPRLPYNYAAAEPSLNDRTLLMRDTAPIDPLQKIQYEADTRGPYAIPDNLGRLLGLDPDDPTTDMANQITRNLYDWGGDRLSESARGLGEMAAFAPTYLDTMLGRPIRAIGDLAGPQVGGVGEDLREFWETTEDIFGPHGMGIRQAQSTFDPLGEALSETVVDPLRAGLSRLDSPAWREYEELRDKFGAEEATGKDLQELINAPFLTIDGEPPPPSTLGAKAELAGYRWGSRLRRDPEAAVAEAARIAEPVAEVVSPEADLEQFATAALVGIARNPQNPLAPEANRIIGRRLAAYAQGQDQPFYQGPLDAGRGLAQAVRGIDIPTPTLPSSRPDVSLPDVDLPSLSLPSLSLPSVSIPTPQPATGQMAQETAIAAQEIPGRISGSLAALPDLGQPTADFAQGLALPSVSIPTPDASGVVDVVRGAVSGARDAVGRATARPPAQAAPAALPAQPGAYSPSTNPQTPEQWLGATTRSLELMRDYSPQDFGARTKRVAVEVEGVRQKLIESADVPGLYVGYVDANGVVVPVGNDVSPDDFVGMVIAHAAEAPDGWGDAPTAASAAAVADPDAATKKAANAEKIASGTASSGDTSTARSSGSRSSGSRSSGGGSGTWDDDGWSGSRSSGRRSGSWDDADRSDFGRDFTADDFLGQAGGDRKKAERMARFANKRRRSKRKGGTQTESSGFWPGFPFQRPPSPIREHVLTAIQESRAAGASRGDRRR